MKPSDPDPLQQDGMDIAPSAEPAIRSSPDNSAAVPAESAAHRFHSTSPLDVLDSLAAPASDEASSIRLVGGAGEHAPSDHPRSGIDEGEPDPPAQFQTIFRQSVLDEVRDHAESQAAVEVCGVLVGSYYENASGAFSYVEACIRGTYATGKTAQVTFTGETWQHIDREMEEKYPGRKILGWYHTHPGFGIFLSEMDLFIQRNFFNAPWQSALVYDPESKERGLFGWKDGNVIRQNFVVDNEVGPAVVEAAGPHESPHPHALTDGPAGGPPGTAAELTTRIKLLEQRQKYMVAAMAALMLVAFVWPLVVLIVMSSPDINTPAPLTPASSLDRPNGGSESQGARDAQADSQ